MLFNKNHNYLQAITAPIFFSFPLVLLLWIGNEMRGWRRYSFASGALACSSNKRYISMDWLKSCLIFSSTSKIDQNCLVELKGQAEQRPWIVILTCFIACFTRIFLKEAWPWKLAFRGLLHPLKEMLKIRFCFFSPKLWHLTPKWLLIDVFYELLDFPQIFPIKTCQNGKIWLKVSWLFQKKSISRKNQRMECVKRQTGTSALLVGIRIVTFY